MTLLERYIAIATLKALVLVSAGMTFLFSLLEFVEQLHDVADGISNDPAAVPAAASVTVNAPRS